MHGFHCIHCGHRIEVPSGRTGSRVACPACENQVEVPQEPASAGEAGVKDAAPSPPPLAGTVPEQMPPSGYESNQRLQRDLIIPTNPFAFISCYAGICSILCFMGGALLGPIAVCFGLLGLKNSNAHESTYGVATNKIRIWIGIITGSLGSIGGVLFIVFSLMDL